MKRSRSATAAIACALVVIAAALGADAWCVSSVATECSATATVVGRNAKAGKGCVATALLATALVLVVIAPASPGRAVVLVVVLVAALVLFSVVDDRPDGNAALTFRADR